ncbi:MAG: protein kinase [Alistipes sp.]|nr:protein kinase [Alistipes sp.]
MTVESDIFNDVERCDEPKSGFCDFKLLKTTAYASLYIAVKSGKRFLVKTTKDKSVWQERLIRREYELACSIEHPHIVHIYALESIEPYGVAMVMEFVDGRTLSDYLAESPNIKERRRIFGELLSAVEYLHRRGVVHNDLKPDNILISNASDTLKLIDFGLADSDAEYAMRTLGCTPRYASPELRNRKNVDARSDIYSLGVIMTEMFGHSRVSRRAASDRPSRRYACVDALRQAWRRRPMRLVATIAVVVAIILIYILYATTSVTKQSETNSSGADTMLSCLEDEMEQIYQTAVDSISVTKYREFDTPYFQTFWRQSDSLATVLMSRVGSDDERIELSARYEYLKHHYYVRLTEHSVLSPSTLSLDGAERLFYLSLLENDLPYRDYSAEEQQDNKRQ